MMRYQSPKPAARDLSEAGNTQVWVRLETVADDDETLCMYSWGRFNLNLTNGEHV